MTRVWDATTEFLGERAGAVFAVTAGLIFAPAMVSGVAERLVTPGTPSGIALQLVGALLSLLGIAGGLAVTALAIRPMSARAAAGIGVRRLFPFVGVSIVLLLALLVGSVPLFVILGASGADFTQMMAGGRSIPDMSTGAAAGILGYALIYLLVLLWAAARLAVLGPVIVAERHGFGAIGRAWSLTRGHALKIIGVYIVYGIVALVLMGGIGFAAGAIGALAGAGQTGFSIAGVIVVAVLAVISAAISVVQSAFTGKLYTALAPATDLEDIFA